MAENELRICAPKLSKEEEESYPAHSHDVITDKDSAHKLGLDPLTQQNLLKV